MTWIKGESHDGTRRLSIETEHIVSVEEGPNRVMIHVLKDNAKVAYDFGDERTRNCLPIEIGTQLVELINREKSRQEQERNYE